MQPLIPYLRQSLGRQGETATDALSLETQLAAIAAWAGLHGYLVQEPVRDHDEIGSDPNRPGLATLRAKAEPGTTIAVYKWDRLARDLVLQETLVREFAARDVAIVSVSEGNEKLSRMILGAFAELWRDQHSQRMTDIVASRTRRGLPHGVTPYGYLRSEGRFVPDPRTAPTIRSIFARWIDGEPIRQIAASLPPPSPRGHSQWQPITVAQMLKNPVYMGTIIVGGLVTENAHEPLVDAATWKAAQRRFRIVIRDKSHRSWVEGLVSHTCGKRMVLLMSSTGPAFRCVSYNDLDGHCGEPRRFIMRHLLEDAARSCLAHDLGNLLSPAEAIRLAEAAYQNTPRSDERAALEARLAEAQQRYDRAREWYLMGRESLEWLSTQEGAFTRVTEAITRELAQLPEPPDPDALTAAAAALGSMADVIGQAEPSDLRLVLDEVGSVVVCEAGVRLVYHPRYRALVPEPRVERLPLGRAENNRARYRPTE